MKHFTGHTYRACLCNGFVVFGLLALLASQSEAQVGTISGPAHSLLACSASVPAPTILRQEGFSELLGDIVITCTGGPIMISGAQVPATNITVYMSPSVPITSRILDASNPSMLSEAVLTIDEPGSGLT